MQDFCWLPYEAAGGDLESNDGHGGIYAFKSPTDIYDFYDNDNIAGSVNLWGIVAEHSEGYRAEFAYPKEFWVPEDFDAAMIVRLEETYGVPVVIKKDLPKARHRRHRRHPMKFTSGIQPGLMEVVRDVIYDRESLLGQQRLRLFCLPLGQVSYLADGTAINKSWERTNMVMPASLPAPQRFVIKSIRCAFLEADGRPVPLSDPIYWETTVTLRVYMKQYWHSLAAYVADPQIALGATDWSKIPPAERLNLINSLSAPLTCGNTPIPGTSASVAVEGISIEQQMPFVVQIDNTRKWPNREVLVALEGICARAMF